MPLALTPRSAHLSATPPPQRSRPARILIADDEQTPRRILSEALREKNYEVTAVSSGWEALTCLSKQAFDLVVLDILMPGIDGFEVLRLIRRNASELELPVIMASVKDNSACVVEALELGANDYVTKPINVQVISARIETQLSRKTAFDELRSLKASLEGRIGELSHHISHDVVTGLANRQEFENRLESLIESAEREEAEHVLCYMDLDQFKIVTNACGHDGGDALLRELAKRLRSSMRRHDTLARLGGDEFGILFSHCSLQKALQICHKLRDVLEEFRFRWKSQTLNVSASIGLAAIAGASGKAQDVLMHAESACCTAKERGRNRIHVYCDQDEDVTRRHCELESVLNLQLAMEHDRFRFAYQPIVATASQNAGPSLLNIELLLRLQELDGQLSLPATFLPAAERYNLGVRIDRWVVQAAFRELQARPQLLNALGMCSINLSGQSLGDEGFLTLLNSLFDSTDIPGSKICFEITETAAIGNFPVATHFIETLRRKGVRFALDDFGTGMSSFAYLKNLPVDFLKIDGAFVKDIVNDEISCAMVKSVNEIGHAMGKWTIAEYVENEEILARLVSIGVDYVQGIHLGGPRSIELLTSPCD